MQWAHGRGFESRTCELSDFETHKLFGRQNRVARAYVDESFIFFIFIFASTSHSDSMIAVTSDLRAYLSSLFLTGTEEGFDRARRFETVQRPEASSFKPRNHLVTHHNTVRGNTIWYQGR